MIGVCGEARKGVHEARIPVLDLALFDTIGTLIVAYLLAKYVLHTNTTIVFLALWSVGIVFHCMGGIKTPMTEIFCPK